MMYRSQDVRYEDKYVSAFLRRDSSFDQNQQE